MGDHATGPATKVTEATREVPRASIQAILTGSPGANARTAFWSWVAVRTRVLLTHVKVSPGVIPARAAGVSG